MNKSNSKLLDIEDLLNTYSYKIPTKQLKLINDRSWFPIHENSEFTKECAYLIGKIMGDGHLSKNFNAIFIGQRREIINLKKIILHAFGIEESRFSIICRKGEGMSCKGISYRLSVADTLLGRMLYSLGAPQGNKTKQEFGVPNWIYISKENSKMFLKALLEDELTTIRIEKCYHSIQPKLKMAKRMKYISDLDAFMQQVKQCIESFDVQCSNLSKPSQIRDTNSWEIYFHINRNKENIIRFAKEIGFRAYSEKVRKLNECASILERTRFHRKPIIDTERILNLRAENYSIRQISRIVGLNRTSVHRVIKKMQLAK